VILFNARNVRKYNRNKKKRNSNRTKLKKPLQDNVDDDTSSRLGLFYWWMRT